MHQSDHDEMKNSIRSYVNRLNDLDSLKELFIKEDGLNYAYAQSEISTKGWSKEFYKITNGLKIDIKLIAQKASIDIIYVNISRYDEKEWKKITQKIFKEHAGYCLIITHKSNDSRWLFTGFIDSSKSSDILLEVTDDGVPDLFIDWLVKIKTQDDETPSSLIKKINAAFYYVKNVRNKLTWKIQQNNELLQTILFIARSSDYYGEIEIEVLQQSLDNKSLFQNVDWLKDGAIITKTNNKYRISQIGKEIIFSILKSDIKNFVTNSVTSVVQLYDSRKFDLPPSLVLKFLKSDQNEITPYLIQDKKCNLFWGRESIEKDRVGKIFDKLLTTIRSILMETSYPLATKKIVEELEKRDHELGLFCTEELLLDLSKRGIVTRDGDSWIYSTENRVLYIMKNNPTSFFSLTRIMEEAVIPPAESKSLKCALDDLISKQKVIEISSHVWSYNSGDVNEIIKRYLILQIKKYLRIKKFDTDELIGRLKRISINPLSKKNQEKYIRMALHSMINNNEIIMKDGMYMINNHS